MKYWIVLLFVFPMALGAEEPWSVSDSAPVMPDPHAPQHKASKPDGMLQLYQEYISSFDGPRCPMSPTCSRYATQARQRFGMLVAVVLTADRLMHEGDKLDPFKVVRMGGQYRFVDSLESNVYWWAGS